MVQYFFVVVLEGFFLFHKAVAVTFFWQCLHNASLCFYNSKSSIPPTVHISNFAQVQIASSVIESLSLCNECMLNANANRNNIFKHLTSAVLTILTQKGT